MNNNININKMKALGFVEVIIAIVVVGVISTVFLTMSGRAMRELVQTERLETMKRVAKNGVHIAEEIANREKNALPGEEYFPVEGVDYCYIPVKNGDQYYFEGNSDGASDYISISLLQLVTQDSNPIRDWAIENAVFDIDNDPNTDDDYFLVMCISDIDLSGTRWANVYFWVGDIHVKGERTSDTDMKDFKYYAIIDL